MKKDCVLFLIPDQFGYSAGYYYYCKYLLKNGFKVSVVCLDMKKPKINLDGNFSVYYIKMTNSLIYRLKMFFKVLSLKTSHQIFILKYLSGISILTILLFNKKVFLDIRTGSIRASKTSMIIGNSFILLESFFFKKVFILSKRLAEKLYIPKSKIIWLPLGADEIATNKKNYTNSFNLMYIGTFRDRNLVECIKGFALFYKEYNSLIPISFDIIGSGPIQERIKINNEIEKSGLGDVIILHGELNHQQAKSFFEKCNYGVSFVPITNYYNFQPPTKTFEYILSGLVCIATKTYANIELVNENNGVLHDDNAQSFYEALVKTYSKRNIYNTKMIKETLNDYKWDKIVENIMIANF